MQGAVFLQFIQRSRQGEESQEGVDHISPGDGEEVQAGQCGYLVVPCVIIYGAVEVKAMS